MYRFLLQPVLKEMQYAAEPLKSSHASKRLVFRCFPPRLRLRGFSHSRPEEVPISKRERMLSRPAETFKRPTGRGKLPPPGRPSAAPEGGRFFLIAPTRAASQRQERNPKFSPWRFALKQSQTADELLHTLEKAILASEVDSSVFGAAMQRCGLGRWWDALLEVHARQRLIDEDMAFLQRRIFFAALASCLKDRSGGKGAAETLAQRKKQGLALGTELWEGLGSQLGTSSELSREEYNMLLGSAWSLCAAVGEFSAIAW